MADSLNTDTGPALSVGAAGGGSPGSTTWPRSSRVTRGGGASTMPMRAAPAASPTPSETSVPRSSASDAGTRATSVKPAALAAATMLSRSTASASSGTTTASFVGALAVLLTAARPRTWVMTAVRAPVRPRAARASGSRTIGSAASTAASPTRTAPSTPAATAAGTAGPEVPSGTTRTSSGLDPQTAAPIESSLIWMPKHAVTGVEARRPALAATPLATSCRRKTEKRLAMYGGMPAASRRPHRRGNRGLGFERRG